MHMGNIKWAVALYSMGSTTIVMYVCRYRLYPIMAKFQVGVSLANLSCRHGFQWTSSGGEGRELVHGPRI